MKGRQLLAVLAAAMAAFLAMAMGAISTASADDCTVTVTLVSGQILVFHVNVAPGTPISAMGLPITGPVASESEQCAPATSTAPAVSVTTTTTTTTPDEQLDDADQLDHHVTSRHNLNLNLNFTLTPWRGLVVEHHHELVEHHPGADRHQPG